MHYCVRERRGSDGEFSFGERRAHELPRRDSGILAATPYSRGSAAQMLIKNGSVFQEGKKKEISS